MVSRILRRKLRRDLWRQRWQFLAAAIVIALGVAVYIGTSDAYRNLGQSFDEAYAAQRLPDVVLTGTGATALGSEAVSLPGQPVVDTRRQGDVAVKIRGRTFLGRAVAVPDRSQPLVARLAVRSGSLPDQGQVAVEQHLTDHYGLAPGDTVQLLSTTGWRTFAVSGSVLSTEYFWPARSMQEVMTTPENFGVVFTTDASLATAVAVPVEQLLLYAPHRHDAAALAAAAARLAERHGLIVTTRDDQPSYRTLQDDVDAVGTVANLLPWLFLSAAVLGTYVLLSRVVAAQRAVIGTLRANGVSARALRRHYLGFGVTAGLAGSVPGVVTGYYLGGWFTTAYTDALGLPLRVTELHVASQAIGLLVGTAAAALAAWAPARAASRTRPAEAMRITPPGVRGGLSGAERALPPLRRLPARWRMALRGITRSRRRTLLTIIGVAVSVSLVMVFAGMRDTVNNVIDRQFGRVQLENAEVLTQPGAADGVRSRLESDPDIRRVEPIARYDVTLSFEGRSMQTLMAGMEPQTAMHRFTAEDGSASTLPSRGVLLGGGVGATLGVDVGNVVSVTVAQTGQRLSEPVVGFVEEPMNPVVYISLDHLSRRTGWAGPTGLLLRLRPGADPDAVYSRVTTLPGVMAYLSTDTVETTMREAFALYDTLTGLMLAFAALMAAALLYSAMSANVAERSVELGTLQAAGVSTGMLSRLVAAENLALVVVGLPGGLALGALLATWFMSTFETQGHRWSLDMQAPTPLVVAAGVLAAALAAQLPALRATRRLDVARIVRERSL